MLKIIIFVLLVVTAVEGLVTLLAKHPTSGMLMMGGCGLFLAAVHHITVFNIWADPKLRDGVTLLFCAWAGFGVWLLVKEAKGK